MSASSVAFIGALTYTYRELLGVLEEHLEDNEGEVLPHLVMSDVIRWLVAHRKTDQALVEEIFSWISRAYTDGDDQIQNVIALSGVEMIPDPGQPGSELRNLLSPELSKLDPWL